MPQPASRRRRTVRDEDYRRLLSVRTTLRRFEHWSAERATEHGLTPSQHQLLLAVRGHVDREAVEPDGRATSEPMPTIRQVAEYLLIRHHSAVELVDRTERAGLVERVHDDDDHRVVRLRLSARGQQILADLSGAHLEELARLVPLVESMLAALDGR